MKIRFLIITLFFSLITFSQERVLVNYSDAPLSTVLSDIEAKFQIKFSFKSQLIKNLKVNLKKENTTLEEILTALTEQTKLVYKKISNRYYLVKKDGRINLGKLQELEEVLISEYPTLGIKKKRDGSVSIVPEKLGILPGLTEPDVLQSLQILPGVQSPDETASGLFIRGATPDQNLVLWDGIKMYYSGHFFGLLSAFNPYITKEISLSKNGARARYGNAVSGVVDITSTPEIPKTIQGGFGLNLINADAYLKAPITKDIGVVISARRSFTDVFKSVTFNNLSDRIFQNITTFTDNVQDDIQIMSSRDDIFYFGDYTAKIIAKLSSKDKLTFSTLYAKNNLHYRFEAQDNIETSEDMLDIKNEGGSLTWNRQFNDKLSLNTQAYFSNFKLGYRGEKTFLDFIEEGRKRNDVKEVGFSFETDYSFNKTHKLFSGYQFSSTQVDYFLFSFSEVFGITSTAEEADHNNTHALFSEYQYNTKKVKFTAGIRANNYSNVKKTYIEPRLRSEVKLNDNFSVKAALESRSQPISQIIEFQSSQLGFAIENQIWVLADKEAFPIQRSQQYSAGILYNKNNWGIDIEGYYRDITGLTTIARGLENISDFFQEGESDVFGVDILVKKKMNNYRTWMGYSYLNNKIVVDGFNDNRAVPGDFDTTHNFTWSHAYKWKSLEFSLGWKYRTGTPYNPLNSIITDADGFLVFNFGETNSERLPNYHRLDFSSTYRFKFSKKGKLRGKLGVSLLNVYNQKNILRRQFGIGEALDETERPNYQIRQVDNVSLGLTPNVLFRVDF